MKKTVIFLILAAFAITAQAQNAQSIAQDKLFKGNVLSVEEIVYKTEYGDLGRKYIDNSKYLLFDTEGNKIQENIYESSGVLSKKTKYDNHGNTIEESRYNKDGT